MAWETLEETWIERSPVNHTVWVPVFPTGDQTCFLYAGHQREVKRYVEWWMIDSSYDHEITEDTKMRWFKDPDYDKQYLQIWSDDAGD